MTARKKTIKKPSFVITYVISLLIVSPFLIGVVGLLLYNSERTKYYSRVGANLSQNYSDVENEIFNYLAKDREKITKSDTVWLKWILVNHYSETGQYIEVYKDNELVADAKRTVTLTYNESSDNALGGYKHYKLEIADKKYMEYFNTPEADNYYYCDNVGDGYDMPYEGFRIQPYLDFDCSEFYADLENAKFVPVAVRFTKHKNDEPGTSLEIRITPDPKDIEGFTLIKIGENSEDHAAGSMDGIEGQPVEPPYGGGFMDFERTCYFNLNSFLIKDFEVVYGYDIINILMVFVLGSFVFALVPATIRYNINKRNYEIFHYRLKTANAMAHDLKTPLASIIAYAEILNNNIDADNREHYLTKISDTASKMNCIVNSILQFSRSENAEVPVNKSEVSAPELIAAVINENEQQINEKGLTTDFDSSEELKLNTDKELLHQALGNLINNAAKYAKEGTIVRIKYDEEMISITNETAEPIEDIANIKDPFIKGNSSRQNGGTGLGLAIANNDLAMLGYKLDIRCEGDVFTATIKLRK